MAQASFFCSHCKTQRLFTAEEMSHTPHILASVFLCGLWLPIWLILAATFNPRYHCSQCGFTDAPKYLANPQLRQFEADRANEKYISHINEVHTPMDTWKIGTIVLAAILLFGGGLFLMIKLNVGSSPTVQAIPTATPYPTPQPFETFAFTTTYKDVVDKLGKPDKEVSSAPPDAKIPNTMLLYNNRKIVVFVVYDLPFSGKFLNAKSHYLGTKGLSPEKVLHVSNEKYRLLIDAYKFEK